MVSETMLNKLDAWWRASNFLSAGQLYLLDNPLLKQPLKPEHIKRRSWATGAPFPARTSSIPT